LETELWKHMASKMDHDYFVNLVSKVQVGEFMLSVEIV